MKRAILIATAMVFSLAAAALATHPPVVLWQDSFEAYAIGTPLPNCPTWIGDLVAYTIQDGGGGNHVVQTAMAAWNTQYAWTNFNMGMDPYDVQWIHFKARSAEVATDVRFRDSVAATTNSGQEVARWQVNASQYKSRISWAGENGPAVNYNDGAWHDFDLIWNRTVGTFEYKVDGVLYRSLAVGETRAVHNIEFWGQTWYGGPGWQYDDFAVGTIPEPSSLLALSALGVGAFGFIRRRRA